MITIIGLAALLVISVAMLLELWARFGRRSLTSLLCGFLTGFVTGVGFAALLRLSSMA